MKLSRARLHCAQEPSGYGFLPSYSLSATERHGAFNIHCGFTRRQTICLHQAQLACRVLGTWQLILNNEETSGRGGC